MTPDAGVRIVLAEDLREQADARRVFDEVWPGEDTQVTSNLLRALVHCGGYCSIAYDSETGAAVGAALGVIGHDRAVPGGTYLHSHMAGVREGLRDSGIGRALKFHQRDWAIARGVPVIAWTFDPLVRRNARLNITRLGVTVRDYHPDFYGEMSDSINAGDRTDRVVAWWEVESPRARQATAGGIATPSAAGLRLNGARDLLRSDTDGRPVAEATADEGGTLLVALPPDIVAVRSADPARALEWRLAVREAITGAYAAGLRIDAVSDEGGYVLVDARGGES